MAHKTKTQLSWPYGCSVMQTSVIHRENQIHVAFSLSHMEVELHVNLALTRPWFGTDLDHHQSGMFAMLFPWLRPRTALRRADTKANWTVSMRFQLMEKFLSYLMGHIKNNCLDDTRAAYTSRTCRMVQMKADIACTDCGSHNNKGICWNDVTKPRGPAGLRCLVGFRVVWYDEMYTNSFYKCCRYCFGLFIFHLRNNRRSL